MAQDVGPLCTRRLRKARRTACALAAVGLAAAGPATALSVPAQLAFAQAPMTGACVSPATLDWIWPVDDREGVIVTGVGKIGMPADCDYDICARPLTPLQVANRLDRPASRSEWDTIYATYAEYCRKEATPLDGTATAAVSPAEVIEDIRSNDVFVSLPGGGETSRTFTPPARRGGGGLGGGGGGGGFGGGGGGGTTGVSEPAAQSGVRTFLGGTDLLTPQLGGPTDDPTNGPNRGSRTQPQPQRLVERLPPETVAPVPLPGGLALLLGAIGVMALRRRT